MKPGGIIGLGLAACAFGALMPGVREVVRPGAAGQALAAGTGASDQPDYLTGEMVLERQEDGHFYARVSINSVPVDALVDTGASVVALTGADAEAIGIAWDPSQVRIVGQGASGPVEGVVVRLDRVELGDFEVHDVEAMVIPDGLHVSLLGQSFLSRIPSVAISDDRMNLSDQ